MKVPIVIVIVSDGLARGFRVCCRVQTVQGVISEGPRLATLSHRQQIVARIVLCSSTIDFIRIPLIAENSLAQSACGMLR